MPLYLPQTLLQQREARVTSPQTTTSGTPGPIAQATVTIVKVAGTNLVVRCTFSANNSSALGATTNFELRQAGVLITGTSTAQTTPALANSKQSGCMGRLLTGLAAGSYQYDAYWSNTAGTSRIDPSTGQESMVLSVDETFCPRSP